MEQLTRLNPPRLHQLFHLFLRVSLFYGYQSYKALKSGRNINLFHIFSD